MPMKILTHKLILALLAVALQFGAVLADDKPANDEKPDASKPAAANEPAKDGKPAKEEDQSNKAIKERTAAAAKAKAQVQFRVVPMVIGNGQLIINDGGTVPPLALASPTRSTKTASPPNSSKSSSASNQCLNPNSPLPTASASSTTICTKFSPLPGTKAPKKSPKTSAPPNSCPAAW